MNSLFWKLYKGLRFNTFLNKEYKFTYTHNNDKINFY